MLSLTSALVESQVDFVFSEVAACVATSVDPKGGVTTVEVVSFRDSAVLLATDVSVGAIASRVVVRYMDSSVAVADSVTVSEVEKVDVGTGSAAEVNGEWWLESVFVEGVVECVVLIFEVLVSDISVVVSVDGPSFASWTDFVPVVVASVVVPGAFSPVFSRVSTGRSEEFDSSRVDSSTSSVHVRVVV